MTLTPFATGFVLGVVIGGCLALVAVLLVVWVAAETKARNANLHQSFERARRS